MDSLNTAVSTGIDGGSKGARKKTMLELKHFREQHMWDLWLDLEKYENIENVNDSGIVEEEAVLDGSLTGANSPYAEVRAAVPPTDDQGLPTDTLRAWVIGIFLCTVISSANVLMSLLAVPVNVKADLALLVAYPIGCLAAKVIPDKSLRLLGHTLRLNPGPFNIKEHTLIMAMTAAGASTSYAINVLSAQEFYYHKRFGWWFEVFLIVSSQAMGLGMAGITRRFLVWPSSMIWPSTLITSAVVHSLHNHQGADPAATNGWKIGRYRFFLIVAGATFAWEWMPQVIAPFLQYFSFITWIAPNNVLVNQLFGISSGLGLLPISFDWNNVSSYFHSPLQFPTFTLFNMGIGVLICTIGAACLGFAGPDYYRYLPINANKNWDRYAKPYNTSRVLNADSTLNVTAYKDYSPLLLSPNIALCYSLEFAVLTATFTHIVLFYGVDVWRRTCNSKYDEPDIHFKLMRRYREAPKRGFIAILAVSFALGMIAVLHWDTQLPWWAYLLCILMGMAFFVPVGMLQAISGTQVGLNVITELTIGYLLPGRPIALMLFKCWGHSMTLNGLQYVADMKVGHYLKVPPRSMFKAQAFAVLWLPIVQVATWNFLIRNVKRICEEDQKQGLACPNARMYYTASVIWGTIGPKRVFGAGGLYSWANYFWLVGFLLPFVQYLIARRWPRSSIRYVVWPTAFDVAAYMPPVALYHLWQFVIVGLVFNWWIRRRYPGWWSEYNYVLSGALDTGLASCIIIATLALGLSGAKFPEWWGNTVRFGTADYKSTARSKLFIDNVTAPIGPAEW